MTEQKPLTEDELDRIAYGLLVALNRNEAHSIQSPDVAEWVGMYGRRLVDEVIRLRSELADAKRLAEYRHKLMRDAWRAIAAEVVGGH